jgi:ABC-2 type transport system ATP-binding protein
MTIQIENLRKYYGPSRGVENATFEINEGEILGFIGPNGAGKSTVIRVLMNLISKTTGKVEILGQEPSFVVNESIGYLPSEVFLYSELTVLEQLVYFAKIRKSDEKRIYELAEALDLDLTKKIRRLSFGNRKKVGIVAALMHSPKIIILDEPTSGLDPLIQQKFFQLLETEKTKGATILLSSHNLGEVEKLCDRVALIKDGVVLFSDSITNIKKNAYKKVFIAPVIEDLKVTGLQLLSMDNDQMICSYSGDINDLLKKLTAFKLDKLNITDLELEEIFMHYYQKETDIHD